MTLLFLCLEIPKKSPDVQYQSAEMLQPSKNV